MAMETGTAIKHVTEGVKVGIQKALVAYPEYVKNYIVKGGEGATSLWELICTKELSNKPKETHSLFGRVPGVKHGDKTPERGSPKEYSFEIVNEPWIDSFAVNLYALDDDQTGDVSKLGEQLMTNFLFHRDKRCFDRLTMANGSDEGPTGFDGVGLISNSHPVGGTTADNLLATQFSMANLIAAFGAMEAFTDPENDQPAYAVPNILAVPPVQRFAAWETVASTYRVADSTTWAAAVAPIMNPMVAYNLAVIVVPFSLVNSSLANAEWYLFDSSKPYKAMIFQERMAPTLKVTKPDGETAIEDNEVLYTMRSRYDFGAGYWPYVIKGK